MRRLFLLLSLLLLPTSAACATQIPAAYSAHPIRGWVVDASTGQPLEGVIVVAQWILYDTGMGGQNPRGRLEVLETVTAGDGSYAFPGWGPKPNPRVTVDIAHYYACCFLTDRDPQLSFFKAGYRKLRLINQRSHDSSTRTSGWDGKTIELERFRGSPEDWARVLDSLQTDVSWGRELDWRASPRIVLAIEDERLRLPERAAWSVSTLEVLGTSREEILRVLRGKP